jgi:hypothetical protein
MYIGKLLGKSRAHFMNLISLQEFGGLPRDLETQTVD